MAGLFLFPWSFTAYWVAFDSFCHYEPLSQICLAAAGAEILTFCGMALDRLYRLYRRLSDKDDNSGHRFLRILFDGSIISVIVMVIGYLH